MAVGVDALAAADGRAMVARPWHSRSARRPALRDFLAAVHRQSGFMQYPLLMLEDFPKPARCLARLSDSQPQLAVSTAGHRRD
jgi:hypothetical protein